MSRSPDLPTKSVLEFATPHPVEYARSKHNRRAFLSGSRSYASPVALPVQGQTSPVLYRQPVANVTGLKYCNLYLESCQDWMVNYDFEQALAFFKVYVEREVDEGLIIACSRDDEYACRIVAALNYPFYFIEPKEKRKAVLWCPWSFYFGTTKVLKKVKLLGNKRHIGVFLV